MQAATHTLRLVLMCLLIALLAACSSTKRSGGYYKDDGPEANPPSNLDAVPDAIPKIEPFASGANKPYVALGRSYTPDVSGGPYKAQGRASWYGKKFHGNKTSTGERYDMYAMTAAHTTLPIPSYVRVTRVSNGKSVVLRVNDRGPFHDDRIIDLSYVAAYKLGMLSPGSAEVIVERITPDQIRNWDSFKSSPAVASAAPIAPDINASVAATEPPPSTQANRNAIESRQLDPIQPLLQPAVQTVSSQTPPATPQAAQNTPKKAVAPGSMFLQVGAFSDQTKAETLANQLSGQITSSLGHPVFVEQTPNNLYRVRIGPFASRDAAIQAVTPIQSATGLAPSLSAP